MLRHLIAASSISLLLSLTLLPSDLSAAEPD